VGSRPTPYITSLEGGGFLNNNVILGPIRAGTPGALAETYVINLIGITPGSGYSQLLTANPNGGVLNLTTNGGRYNYNSLQVELRRRFTGGLSLTGNYTFQKILTDVTGTQSEANQTRVEPYLDNNNPSRDYSRPAYDRTHTFNFNGLYELPFGNGKRWLNQGGWVDRVFGGFQFSSILNISSGVPTSITDARGTLNRGVARASAGDLVADRSADCEPVRRFQDSEWRLRRQSECAVRDGNTPDAPSPHWRRFDAATARRLHAHKRPGLATSRHGVVRRPGVLPECSWFDRQPVT